MPIVVLSGPSDALGRRVRALLDADVSVERVIELGEVDLGGSDLKRTVEGGDCLVHLAGGVDDTRSVLEAAGSAGIGHVVLLSSATAYGAWANNPVPLTEDAALRPNPDLEFAVNAAERERLLAEWRIEHPIATATVLRPTVPVAEEEAGWLASALRAMAAIRAGDDEPPAQFVHLDDLAGAIDLARRQRLDGPFNVAPDGFIAGDQLHALAGLPRVRLSERAARRLAGWRYKLRLAPSPPGVIAYTQHPWVVANDRLKAAGWSAAWSNEEAYVATHAPTPWASVSPRRRQELALVVSALAVVGAAAGLVAVIRRQRRRRGGTTTAG